MGVKSFQGTLDIAAFRASSALRDMFKKDGPLDVELKALRKAGVTIADQRLRIADLALQGARQVLFEKAKRKPGPWPPTGKK